MDLVNNEKVYPHSLSFLDITWCDVCGKDPFRKYTNQWIIDSNHSIIGWQYCTSEVCKKTIEIWQNTYVIPKQVIIDDFGSFFVRVKRSSGKFDTNWNICSDSFNSLGIFIICVEDSINNLKKYVTLTNLINWNKKT